MKKANDVVVCCGLRDTFGSGTWGGDASQVDVCLIFEHASSSSKSRMLVIPVFEVMSDAGDSLEDL